MGYSIQYGTSGKLEESWHANKKKIKRKIAAAVLVCAAVLALLFSGSVEAVRDFLVPGNPEITKAAFAQFTENIRQGNNVSDAIYTFCREIIENASIPE